MTETQVEPEETLEISLASEHDADQDQQEQPAEGDTFPRKVVEDLRAENAKYRTKAKNVDILNSAYFDALVRLNGSLHDSADLAYSEDYLNEDGLPDNDKVDTAVEELLVRKPYLRKVAPRGDVGQGNQSAESFSLLDAIRT